MEINKNEKILTEEEKDIMELEKVLSNQSISINDYSNAFFTINTAQSKGIIKNPLRFYLALKNASVVVKADDNGSQLDVYKNLVNTVNYLISEYAKKYISSDIDLDNYIGVLQNSIEESKYITFDVFKSAYYLFEVYVLAGIKGNKFYDFICALNESYVESDKVNEIIDLTNMKARLSSYIESYKKDYSKKIVR